MTGLLRTLATLVLVAFCPVAAGQSAVSVTITSPVNEETVHDNSGELNVVVDLEGGDAPDADRLALRALIDGAPYGGDQTSTAFTLRGIERGAHELVVQVIDARGRIIAVSAAVTFYMWQASRLFPGRKRPL